MSSVNGMPRSNKTNAIYIIGLGHEYPPHSVRQEQFEDVLERLCPDEITSPASVIQCLSWKILVQC